MIPKEPTPMREPVHKSIPKKESILIEESIPNRESNPNGELILSRELIPIVQRSPLTVTPSGLRKSVSVSRCHYNHILLT